MVVLLEPKSGMIILFILALLYGGFYYYNQDGDIERMSINFDDIKIKEVEEDTARLEVYVEQETNTYCSVLLGCETETKPISNEQYMLIVPKGTITGSDELVFE